MSPAAGHEQEDDDEEDDDVLEDDGMTSSSNEEFTDAIDDAEPIESPSDSAVTENLVETIYDTAAGLPPPKSITGLRHASEEQELRTEGLLTPTRKPAQTPSRQPSLPGYFDRPTKHDGSESPGYSVPATPGDSRRRPIFKRNRSATPSKRSTKDFNFDASQGKDVLGIVMVEIKSATDLPKIKNCRYQTSNATQLTNGSV